MFKPARPSGKRTGRRNKAEAGSKSMMGNTLSVAAFKEMDPFPPMIRRNFKYCGVHQLTTNASTGTFGTEQRYNLNALYDPDYTGSGHQPYGFDQIMAGYNKYRVERVSFKILFTTPGSAADMIGAASVAPGTSASLAAVTLAYPFEWPNFIHGHISSAGERKCVLTGSINLWDLFGVTKARYDADDIYTGSVSANPTALALLSFAVASYSGATSQAASSLIELEYTAVIYDRLNMAPS